MGTIFVPNFWPNSTPESTIKNPPFPPPLPLLFSFVMRAFQRCIAGLKRTNLRGWRASARFGKSANLNGFGRFAPRSIEKLGSKISHFSDFHELTPLCIIEHADFDGLIFAFRFCACVVKIADQISTKTAQKCHSIIIFGVRPCT